MAGDPSSWTPMDLLAGLPPQLQGIAVLGVAITVGYLVWRKYLRQGQGDGPQTSEFAVGDPTTFADMAPLRNLVKNVDILTQQMIKGETTDLALQSSVQTLTVHMSRLCDLMAAFLVDLKEQREEDEIRAAEQRGYDKAQAEKLGRHTTAASNPKRSPRAGA